MHVRAAHALEAAAGADEGPAAARGAVDDGVAGFRGGGQGREQRGQVGDGDAVALVGADEVVCGVGGVDGGGGQGGVWDEREALFGVGGDEGGERGESEFEGAEVPGGELRGGVSFAGQWRSWGGGLFGVGGKTHHVCDIHVPSRPQFQTFSLGPVAQEVA